MRHGRLTVILLALLAATLVCGCGGRSPTTTTLAAGGGRPASGSEAPETTAPSETTASGTPPSSGGVSSSTTAAPHGGAASDVLARMSLESKAAQVLLVTFDGTALTDSTPGIFAQAVPAGVLLLKRNVAGEEQLRSLTAALQQGAASAGAPGLFVAADEEGGSVMRVQEGVPEVPSARKSAATSSAEQAGALAKETGAALLDQGVNMVLAPVADVVAEHDSFLYDRSYGNEPGVVSDFVAAVTAGFHDGGLITVAKHFPGHGSAPDDSHTSAPVSAATRAQFESIHLPPFRAAAAAGADGIMLGHFVASVYDDIRPASQSPVVIQDLLRDGLGFTGLAVSDDLEMAAAAGRTGEVGTADVTQLGAAAVAALQAGCDLLITTSTYDRQVVMQEAIVDAVRTGVLDEARLDEAVSRVLAVKERYGLLPSGAAADQSPSASN